MYGGPIGRLDNFFVSLDVDKYADLLLFVEQKVGIMVDGRHDYPLWPHHNDPLDSWEAEFHGRIRASYYRSAIHLIQVLRALRRLT